MWDVSSLKPNIVVNTFLGNLPLWSLSLMNGGFTCFIFQLLSFDKSSNLFI
jgi:hypothetical protein